MRAVDEQAFDMGFGTEQYQDGNMLNEQNQLQGYFGSGGVSTFIGGGGGGSVSGGGSVVVSETPGTSNYNNKKVIYTLSNIILRCPITKSKESSAQSKDWLSLINQTFSPKLRPLKFLWCSGEQD